MSIADIKDRFNCKKLTESLHKKSPALIVQGYKKPEQKSLISVGFRFDFLPKRIPLIEGLLQTLKTAKSRL